MKLKGPKKMKGSFECTVLFIVPSWVFVLVGTRSTSWHAAIVEQK